MAQFFKFKPSRKIPRRVRTGTRYGIVFSTEMFLKLWKECFHIFGKILACGNIKTHKTPNTTIFNAKIHLYLDVSLDIQLTLMCKFNYSHIWLMDFKEPKTEVLPSRLSILNFLFYFYSIPFNLAAFIWTTISCVFAPP